MDSPAVTRLFRELFRRPACQSRRHCTAATSTLPALSQRRPHPHNHHHKTAAATTRPPTGINGPSTSQQRREYAVKTFAEKQEKTNESKWQQRTSLFPNDRADEFDTYPTLSSRDLAARSTRPRKVKMLTRDFIEDSLYNPAYGYFSTQAVIFSPGQPFDFPAFRDEPHFYRELGQRYTEFEDELDNKEGVNDARPLWHTPTELFRPYYGEAIARYLVSNYRLTTYPYHDLIIYEMGAGRGTLMLNILDYIRDIDPQVYARTQYRIIEISPALASLQRHHLLSTADSRGHAAKVEIINKSIFSWSERVPSPCFFLAMEVFDNFSHDCVRYDLATEEPLQGSVLVDADNDLYEFYSPDLDPVLARFLRVRHAATGGRYPTPYPANRMLRNLKSRMPMMPNLSEPEYIPTRLMQFFDVLEKYFPAHRLVTSDFHSLPDAIPGLNAPVVQTRYERKTVPVTTPLVHQGYFDIMFPTDFQTMEVMYQAITGKLTRLTSHGDFMKCWTFLEDTQTRSGENPLLSYYENASVLVTV
ncbi:Protein arginine methyltransferase NDUFAF7-like protein [Colletotrichum shisoi]|uniref:Protein arginine methyltransferase NDUFAF7 n=1 Tax=Colletotrichum shisoi TaxID=2078593 RepID=A0A5Q4BT09_9PEZI|nr:Protein arginine methyltransferase NDUFAF7-like protein [Colletotrichum shisoi]